jgi:hypothetical protein
MNFNELSAFGLQVEELKSDVGRLSGEGAELRGCLRSHNFSEGVDSVSQIPDSF